MVTQPRCTLRFPFPKREKRALTIAILEVYATMTIHAVVFWIMTPCMSVGGYKRFGKTDSIAYPEDGGSMFLRNVGTHIKLQCHKPEYRSMHMFISKKN
jgi:hypothetical protein